MKKSAKIEINMLPMLTIANSIANNSVIVMLTGNTKITLHHTDTVLAWADEAYKEKVKSILN